MSMVTSTVVNLQCNYLSQTKTCGQKWREMSMGVILHRKWVLEWHVHSILLLQGRMEWKSIPFCPWRAIQHVGKNGMLHQVRVPILSFWHTNFMKQSHVGSWPLLRGRPPYGKSWIRHWIRMVTLDTNTKLTVFWRLHVTIDITLPWRPITL